MTDASSQPLPPLPRGWGAYLKRALLCAIGLARIALAEVRAGYENSPDPRAALTAALDEAHERLALLEELHRIHCARMASIEPAKRPHYAPAERLAILRLRTKMGWNATEVAQRLLVTPATIASWMRRLDEEGADALVQTAQPVNRYDDQVALVANDLHAAAPVMGRRKLADVLARAGLHIAASTVRRMRLRKPPAPPAPLPPAPREPEAATMAPPDEEQPKPARVVTAKYTDHLWHVDLTAIAVGPNCMGFWVPWWPFALIMRWLFCWRIALVLDHYSRALIAFAVYRKEPTGLEMCAFLDRAIALAGRAPKYIVSDQGTQFRKDYRAWCRERNIRPRFGAVRKHGSIALIERFIGSLKSEFLRRIRIPSAESGMLAALAAYQLWYNEHRPHAALRGRTPAEVRDGVPAARELPAMEPRARYPVSAPDRHCGKLELALTYVDGWRELPVVALREAA